MRSATDSRRPDRATAALVALAILLGGMPLTLGIVVHSSEAMFTPDICHPVQSLSHSPVAVAAIFPDSPAVAQSLPERGRHRVPTMALRARAADALYPPPPKIPA